MPDEIRSRRPVPRPATLPPPRRGNAAAGSPAEEAPAPITGPVPSTPVLPGPIPTTPILPGPILPGPVLPAPAPVAPRDVVVAAGVAGLGGAAFVPLGGPGIGWSVAALIAVGAVAVVVHRSTERLPRTSVAWAALALALVGTAALRAAGWLFALCLLGAFAAASLAVSGWSALAVPRDLLASVPWIGRALSGLRTGSPARLGVPIVASAGVLAVFTPLLASADAEFADALSSLVPELGGGTLVRWVFLFVLSALVTAAACRAVLLRGSPPSPTPRTRSAGRTEWAVPVSVLVLLFAAFVGVRIATLFGGSAHVLRTGGLTYAGYARSGFWQLLVVSALTLGVVGVVLRTARRDTPADRAWLRGLIGALTVLSLVIVASALSRMVAYQQAYGFTVLRLLVTACELWLGLVHVLVLVACARLRAGWLPRAGLVTGLGALLVLSLANPEWIVAEQNVTRRQHTGTIDLTYLGGLSTDVVPALGGLPERERRCVLTRVVTGVDTPQWREWNASTAHALRVAAAEPGVSAISCSEPYGR